MNVLISFLFKSNGLFSFEIKNNSVLQESSELYFSIIFFINSLEISSISPVFSEYIEFKNLEQSITEPNS